MTDTAHANATADYDLVVIGSGAGGMAAALTAQIHGLSVVILEKTDQVGGSTAVSGGAVWIPGNSLMASVGHSDSRDAVMSYLASALGNRLDPALIDAFLDHGPTMIDFFAEHTDVSFIPRALSPDYQSDVQGASMGGRTIDPAPFDARSLGRNFEHLRKPLHVFMVLGGMMVGKKDIDTLLGAFKSPKKFLGSAGLVLRYLSDRLRFSRGTRLLLGNALAGRLYKSVLDRNIPVIRNADVRGLIREGDRISGVEASVDGTHKTFTARRGVILATGGFPGNDAMLAQYVPAPAEHRTMAPASNTGDGIHLALQAGGRIADGNIGSGLWTPVSRIRFDDGTERKFPHLVLDRQKPGLIAVDGQGRRFVNEACSYHEFVEAMHSDESRLPTYLICDAVFLRKYGLGLVRPLYDRPDPFIKAGYLTRADSIADLAGQLGVDPDALANSIASMNKAAETGVDDAFGKGSTAYNRYLGDPDHTPNPCLGQIVRAPFYAVKVWPGDIGTATGLRTDAQSRVLGENDQPIAGLYACGNDMNSIMAGSYPAAGITLGPALTFGYIAGLELAGIDTNTQKNEEASQ